MAETIQPWRLTDNAGSGLVAEAHDKQMSPLGYIAKGQHMDGYGGEFMYAKGAADVAAGDWVVINTDDHSVTLLAANAIGPVGVAMAPTVANTFGWYQRQGKATGNAAATIADNAAVYATATAGRVDDAVVAGDRVKGARCASTAVANLAEFELDRPYVDDVAD